MADRPILFSAPMVRAILSDAKTQTRRVCKPAVNLSFVVDCGDGRWGDEEGDVAFACPYGMPGDRLWVRETWMPGYDHDPDHESGPMVSVLYRADYCDSTVRAPSYEFAEKWRNAFSEDGEAPPSWRPSIHMPRWASRITLEVTGVRVERLQAITEVDAVAEGCRWVGTQGGREFYSAHSYPPGVHVQVFNPTGARTAREAFHHLWDSVGGVCAWDANPWVWVVEFRRVTA